VSYVDGFVIPVPTGNKQAFIEQAREFDTLLMQFGALRVMECWGDDVPAGKLTDFYRAVQAADGETVVFSWVEWPNKATRDAGFAQMEALMQTDPRFKDKPMAFDGKRLIFGGFSPVVEL
jgi:uncharacterized protein YbaA (DUF1428 family)